MKIGHRISDDVLIVIIMTMNILENNQKSLTGQNFPRIAQQDVYFTGYITFISVLRVHCTQSRDRLLYVSLVLSRSAMVSKPDDICFSKVMIANDTTAKTLAMLPIIFFQPFPFLLTCPSKLKAKYLRLHTYLLH